MDAEKISDESTLAPRVIQFPKAKKRGRKVFKGPTADVVVLPATGDDLISDWAAANRKPCYPWEQAAGTRADVQPESWELWVALDHRKRVGERVMRQEVLEFRARIAKFSKIIDRLKTLGARPEDLDSAEDAWIYAFDKLRDSNLFGFAP